MRDVFRLTIGTVCLWASFWAPSAFGSEHQRSLHYRQNFYDVKFQGDQAWVVGYYGTILRSKDRGLTWQVIKSGTKRPLFRVRFVDSEKGWVAGAHGEIFHTRDGGKSWAKQQSGANEHLLGMHFLDERAGWVVGARGTILSTDNGGASWVHRSLKEDVILNDVYFDDSKRGWIVGEFGVIYHTRDGGKTWLKEKSPVEVSPLSGVSSNLFRVLFVPPNTVWAFGLDGVALKNQPGTGWKIAHKDGVTPDAVMNHHLFGAAYVNGRTWAVGERGVVIISDAEKENWQAVNLGAPPLSLNAIAFAQDGVGLIVGDRGLIFRTGDGGKNWRPVKLGSDELAGAKVP